MSMEVKVNKKLIVHLDGTQEFVDMTAEEIAEKERYAEIAAIELAQAQARAEARAALLDRLGITEAEAKLLLA